MDDLVSVDTLIEEHLTVEPINEYVQSCDIVAFNKICKYCYNNYFYTNGFMIVPLVGSFSDQPIIVCTACFWPQKYCMLNCSFWNIDVLFGTFDSCCRIGFVCVGAGDVAVFAGIEDLYAWLMLFMFFILNLYIPNFVCWNLIWVFSCGLWCQWSKWCLLLYYIDRCSIYILRGINFPPPSLFLFPISLGT